MKIVLQKIKKELIHNTNPQKVYDLTIKNAQSFNVNGKIVHNSGCTTTENGSIGYPMASLIEETYQLACTLKTPAKIIADGGIRKYADIIKALALGADYVMIGGLFNKMLESAAPCYKKNIFGFPVKSKNPSKDFDKGKVLFKIFRGMSTKSVQRELGSTKIRTSEGVEKKNIVKYKLSGWVENLEHYLRSNMSYCNKSKLNDYIGEVDIIHITEKAFKRFNK